MRIAQAMFELFLFFSDIILKMQPTTNFLEIKRDGVFHIAAPQSLNT